MVDQSIVDEFRAYLKNHYGYIDHVPFKSSEIQKILYDNIEVIKDAHMKFEELVNSVNEYVKTKRNPFNFNVLLNDFRIKKGFTSSELRKKAFIDRRIYSRFTDTSSYHPGKKTVITFGLALELDINDMEKLLESAGFCFNTCSIADLAIMYCVEHKIYDIFTVNALLIEVGEKTLHKELT
jgi:hypothetical protein